MHSSAVDEELDVAITNIAVTDEIVRVELEDGRTLTLPTQWYPRLHHGTPAERANFEIGPFGVHWPDLDEDLSTRGFILGRKSGETSASLKFWIDGRKKGRKPTLEDFMKQRRKSKTSRGKKARRSA